MTEWIKMFDLPDGVTLGMMPRLPMVSWKKGKTKISFTDFRYLHQGAAAIFSQIISDIIDGNISKTKSFTVPEDYPEEDLRNIITILISIMLEAKRRGWWMDEHYLITGAHGPYSEEDERVVTFDLAEDAVRSIARLSKSEEEIDIKKIIEAYVEDTDREFDSFLQEANNA